MNILHVNTAGALVGGVEGYIADVSATLHQAGHSSFLIHFSSNDSPGLMPDMRYAPLPE